MRRLLMLGAVVGIVLCVVAPVRAATPGETLVLEGDGVVVELGRSPFSLAVRDGTGALLYADPPGGGHFYARGAHIGGLLRAFEISVPFDLDLIRYRLTDVVSAAPIPSGYELVVGTSEGRTRTATVRVTLTGPRRVHVEVSLSSTHGIYRAGARFAAGPGDHFSGLGEQFSGVDLRGREIPLGGGRYYRGRDFLGGVHLPEQDHSPIPFLVSSRGFGFALWNDGNGVRFDVARRSPNAVEAAALVSSGPISYDVYVGGSGPDRIRTVLSDYTADVGRPEVLPAWAYGVWHSRDRWDSQQAALDEHAQWRRSGLPLDGFVLDSPWETTYQTWRFNPEQFPDAQALLDTLNADGAHPLVWITGWMNTDSSSGDRFDGPLSEQWAANPAEWYEPMADQGLFVEDGSGKPIDVKWWMGRGSLVDFTDPEARAFWTEIAQPAVSQGIAGIKIDGLEGFYVPDGAMFANGRTGADGAWASIRDYRSATAELLQSVRGDDWVSFGRAGWHGVQGQSATWAGDQWSSMAGLREVLSAGLTGGLTGISNWFHDVGGYNGRPPSLAEVLRRAITEPDRGGGILDLFTGFQPDREVVARWAQVGAYTPTFQQHSKAAATPWNYDAEVQDVYRRYTLLHESLVPYIRAMAATARDTGVPIMRSIAIEQPDLASAWTTSDAYLFGDSFFVAPVTEVGARSRTVRLPEGVWVDQTGSLVDGGDEVTVDAPLDTIPVWVRAGAIVPTYPEGVTSVTGSVDPAVTAPEGRLDVRVYAGAAGPTSLATAEGGVFEADTAGLRWHGAVGGDSLLVRLPAATAPSGVTAGGPPVPTAASLADVRASRSGWFHDPATGEVWVGASAEAGDVTLLP